MSGLLRWLYRAEEEEVFYEVLVDPRTSAKSLQCYIIYSPSCSKVFAMSTLFYEKTMHSVR